MVNNPADYPWSSYGAYAAGGHVAITDIHEIYATLGNDPEQRRAAYREYVCSGRPKEDEEFRARTGGGCIGRDGFAEAIHL
jgi:putative transposase